jgi:histone deacetylase complex regulatory component SIN3
MFFRFLDVIVQLKRDKASASKMMDNVCALFHDRPGLLIGFNMFLSEGCRIEYLSPGEVGRSEDVDGTGEEARGEGMMIRLTTPEGTVIRRAEEFAALEVVGKPSRKTKKRKEKAIVEKEEKRRKLDTLQTQKQVPLVVAPPPSATLAADVSTPITSTTVIPFPAPAHKPSTTTIPLPAQTRKPPSSPLRDAMKYVAIVKVSHPPPVTGDVH